MTVDAAIPTPATETVDVQNPWPGLEAFKEEDYDFFHGRETEIEELHRLVQRERLTVLFGVSGLGKTSLLQAGLFPAMRNENVLPVRIRLNYSPGMPELSTQIKEAITREASANHIEAPRFEGTLWESFHRQDADFWNQRNRVVIPLLVFDQFEEVFTRGRETPERARDAEAFLTELADLIEGRAPESVKARIDVDPGEARAYSFQRHNYKVLLSLREDFLADLEGLSERLPSVMLNRLRLCPMNGEQALSAVTRAGGHLIEKDIAARVVRFVGAESVGGRTDLANLEVEPALLSVFCRELNLTRIERNEPQITAELLAGRQSEILSAFYERGLAGIAAPVRAFIEDDLITASGRRNSEPYEEALNKPGVTAEDISLLVNRRLLRIEDRAGMSWLELTHDRLTGVARASRESRRQREAQAAAEAAQREAQEKERRAQQELSEKARTLRLVRSLLVAAVVAMLAAIVGAYFGFREQQRAKAAAGAEREAKHAAQEALAGSNFKEAVNLVERDQAAEALVYLAHALRLDPDQLPIQTYTLSLLSRRNWPLPISVFQGDAEFEGFNLSSDGRLIVTADRDGRGRIWDAATGAAKGGPLVHQGVVTSANFSLDGKSVITASEDKTAQVWSVETGRAVGESLRHDEAVASAGLNPDGTRALTVSADGGSALWEVETGRVLFNLRRGQDVVIVAQLSRDGKRAVTGLQDGTARIWNLETGAPLVTLTGHGKDKRIEHVQFSPDGRRIVTASADGTARIWDVQTGRTIGGPLKHKDVVWHADFTLDGKYVATASDDRTAGIWYVETGLPRVEPIRHPNAVYMVAFSPDGRRLVTTSADYSARVWDVATGRPLTERMRHGDWLEARFSEDGARIVSASWDRTLRLWDVRPSAAVAEPMRHSTQVTSAWFSPKGRYVLTISKDNTTRVWDVETLRPMSEPMAHEAEVTFAEFSPDESRVMTMTQDASSRVWSGERWARSEPLGKAHTLAFSSDWTRALTAVSDSVVESFDVKSGGVIGAPLKHPSKVTAAGLSRDAKRVITVTEDGRARLWDTASGQAVGEPLTDRGGISFARFSPDGRRVLTASKENTARVWDAQTGRATSEPLRHYDSVTSAEFNFDGSRVVTASRDTAFIWNVETGEIIGQPMRHQDNVISVRFSRDGRMVVTASLDQTARVWDAETGQTDGEPLRHDGAVRAAEFSVTGERVVTASDDGTARMWHLLSGSPAEAGALASLAEAVGGSVFSEQGVIVLVKDTIARFTSLRQETAAASGSATRAFIHWFLADRGTRTISPLSRITVPDYNRSRRLEGEASPEQIPLRRQDPRKP
jgi:WD40 repeat protein